MSTKALRSKNESVGKGCPNVKICMRAVNPAYPGVYFGKKFHYDENWMGCWMCWREYEHKRSEE